VIYFLRAGDSDHVKIGWSKDQATLAKRVRTLQTGQPLKLVVFRTIEAERWTEGWLHGFYAGVCAAGEWFRFQHDMLEIMPPLCKPSRPTKVRPVGQIMDPQQANFSAALRRWRASYGWSQQVAADTLGVPRRSYQRWEAGILPDHPVLVLHALRGVTEWVADKRSASDPPPAQPCGTRP